ncbi:hypothetical protein R3P38DRAFT_3071092 [Favolaschia claudopus]|uniref:Zinc finger PHD-type domain-containing protein n=1 Tax=Favolaschia claudopus TaxID=2862362 RepID=A0AAV9ZZ98_9AGAR
MSRTSSPAPAVFAASSRASSSNIMYNSEPASRSPSAPTHENLGADLTSIVVPTGTTSVSFKPAATVASQVLPSSQASATVNPATSPHAALPEPCLSAKRTLTDNLECICGNQVTEDQRVSNSIVKCGRSGCETVWFHEDCADSGGKTGWVCESCKPTKKRR